MSWVSDVMFRSVLPGVSTMSVIARDAVDAVMKDVPGWKSRQEQWRASVATQQWEHSKFDEVLPGVRELVLLELFLVVVEASAMKSSWRDYPALWNQVYRFSAFEESVYIMDSDVHSVLAQLEYEGFSPRVLRDWRERVMSLYRAEVGSVSPWEEDSVTHYRRAARMLSDTARCAASPVAVEVLSRLDVGLIQRILAEHRLSLHGGERMSNMVGAGNAESNESTGEPSSGSGAVTLSADSETVDAELLASVAVEVRVVSGCLAKLGTVLKTGKVKQSPVFHREIVRLIRSGELHPVEALLCSVRVDAAKCWVLGERVMRNALVEVNDTNIEGVSTSLGTDDWGAGSAVEFRGAFVDEQVLMSDAQRVRALKVLSWFDFDGRVWVKDVHEAISVAADDSLYELPMSVLSQVVGECVAEYPLIDSRELPNVWHALRRDCVSLTVLRLWGAPVEVSELSFLFGHGNS
jgi:hypothetical protein